MRGVDCSMRVTARYCTVNCIVDIKGITVGLDMKLFSTYVRGRCLCPGELINPVFLSFKFKISSQNVTVFCRDNAPLWHESLLSPFGRLFAGN